MVLADIIYTSSRHTATTTTGPAPHPVGSDFALPYLQQQQQQQQQRQHRDLQQQQQRKLSGNSAVSAVFARFQQNLQDRDLQQQQRKLSGSGSSNEHGQWNTNRKGKGGYTLTSGAAPRSSTAATPSATHIDKNTSQTLAGRPAPYTSTKTHRKASLAAQRHTHRLKHIAESHLAIPPHTYITCASHDLHATPRQFQIPLAHIQFWASSNISQTT